MHKFVLSVPELLKITPIDDICTVSGFEATNDEVLSFHCAGFVTDDGYYQCDELPKYLKLSIDGTITDRQLELPELELPKPFIIYWYTELDSLKQAITPFEKVLQKQIKAIGYSVYTSYTGDGNIFTSRTAAQDQDFNLNLVEVIPVGGTQWWPSDVSLIIYPYFVTQ